MSGDVRTGLFHRSAVRLVRQTEVAECGLACLAMIANYHGLDIDLGTLRRRFAPSLRGAALKSLIGIADQLGMAARPIKLPLEQIQNLHMPAVLHWDMNHYVVIERMHRGKAIIHNPDGRSRAYSTAELSQHFTGVALELRPADDFQKLELRQTLKLSQLWRRISGLKRALLQTLVLSLVMQAFVLASPYYMQIAIDSALPALDRNLLAVLALGFGLFTLFNGVASLLRSFVLLTVGTSLSFGIASNIARRLFRLPVNWFERRHVGDVLSRFQSVTPIKTALTEGAVGSLLDGALAIFTLLVMFFYSPTLAMIAVLAFALYLAVRIVSFGFQREAQEATIVAAAKEQSTMIESVRGITTLRLFNKEAARHSLWQTKLTDSVNAGVGLARIGIWQQIANTFIFGLENVISVWLAIRFVIDGGFSVGMVFAFFAYKTQFVTKASSLLDQVVAFRMLRLHLERLSDIALADEDRGFAKGDFQERTLAGKIELKDIGYRYGPSDPLVLKDLNLIVEVGSHIAITGPSGGGKSTLVKILLGLDDPTDGEMLIDGIPLARFGYQQFHEQVAGVLQSDNLFAGSIAENIALFDDQPNMERIIHAASTAAIHLDIAAMPMGYETFVGDMGSSLSGGQQQRLLLARALYRQPRLLVIDEGTSHLDAVLEQAVNKAISRLGITRIIIAHRIETILSADKIFACRSGRLEEVTEQYASLRQQMLVTMKARSLQSSEAP